MGGIRIQLAVGANQPKVLHHAGAKALASIGRGGLPFDQLLHVGVTGIHFSHTAFRCLHDLGQGFLFVEAAHQGGAKESNCHKNKCGTMHDVGLMCPC